ncbi:MAG: hypothetical protein WA632_13480 [Gallionella sp.]
MSLSLRDELRVVVCRDHLQWVRFGRKLTLSGIGYQLQEKRIIPFPVASEKPWESATQCLNFALSDAAKKPTVARVVLSNHYARYAMIPWSPDLGNEAEEIAYARHGFAQLYGINADDWEIRMTQDGAGVPQLACAVDETMTRTLRQIFHDAKVKLKSIQPQLMTAYNNCQARFQKLDAWFVSFDQGSLCLGLLQQGHWSSVRCLKVGSDWLMRLPEILDRESYLSELDVTSSEIFLWAPEYWKEDIPGGERWQIHKLQPAIRPSLVSEYDEQFVMAMCG